MSDTSLAAEVRQELGTGASRALRRKGRVPATLYGAGNKPMSISVKENEITKLYRRHGFTSIIIDMDIDGKNHKVLPKSVDLHPITDIVSHVDFVFLDKKIQKVDVPVIFEGRERAICVKRGGFFNIIMRKLPLFCNVGNIPLNIELEVSSMQVGDSIRAKDIKLPEGCSLTSKKDLVIASITGRGSKSDAEESAEGAEESAEGEAKTKAKSKAKEDSSEE